ncbi:MAG: hypothetical protein AAF747_11190 [Planctomycetota bacterium]
MTAATATKTDHIDALTAGQKVTITIAKEPKSQAATKTIARLMRLDADNKRGLRRAQHLRRLRMHTYTRGGRTWYSRERAARVVRVRQGETWTLTFTPQLAGDLRSVASYLDVQSA